MVRTRLDHLPTEQHDHLRQVVEHIDKISSAYSTRIANELFLLKWQYNLENSPNTILIESFERGRDRLSNQLKDALTYSIREFHRDPYLQTLHNYIDGTMRYAKPYRVVKNYGTPFAKIVEEAFDGFTEWALLKLHFARLEYISKHYPLVYGQQSSLSPQQRMAFIAAIQTREI